MGTLTNSELLARLDGALKNVTDVSDLNDAVLQPEKFASFVHTVQDKSVVLDGTRFIEMDAQQTDIDRVGFADRILRPGRPNAEHGTPSSGDFAQPEFHTNKLIAQELMAVTSLRDAALRRNIERGGFEDTLVDLFAQAAARDLEEYALLAGTGDPDHWDGTTDGWLVKAGNEVFDQDFGAPETLFDNMIQALPKKFVTAWTDWVILAPWDVVNGYLDVLRDRGTTRADEFQEQGIGIPGGLRYKGVQVIYAPALERVEGGSRALLSHPDNMVWGVFHEVTVEAEREAKARRTDFVLTIEADAHYEDENGAVVATTEAEPA